MFWQIMTYISKKGERSTSETGYLTKEVLKRPNLTVVTGVRSDFVLICTIFFPLTFLHPGPRHKTSA